MEHSVIIDENKAKKISTNFFEQHNSILDVKGATLEDGVWTVTLLISSFGLELRKILIDAQTGTIIGWHK